MRTSDLGDDWSRFFERLRAIQERETKDVLSGQLKPDRYQYHCGRIALIDEMIEEAHRIRRGEDIAPPREPLRSVEC